MRVVTVIGVLLAGVAASVRAQHAHQIEFGGYGMFTRYDRAFGLKDQFGGGGRIGFFLNDYIGLEVDGNVAYPKLNNPLPGVDHTQMRIGSASLIINSGGSGSVLYILAGYSHVDQGVNPPYNFYNHAVHAGIGERLFLGNHMALRLEARAYYTPKDCCLTHLRVVNATGSAGLSFFLGGGGAPKEQEVPPPEIPKAKRDSIVAAGGQVPVVRPRTGGPSFETRTSDWQHKWYWGGEGGIFIFRTNFDSYAFEPTFGGHWLITGKKTALYTSYEQSFFFNPRHVTIVEPSGTVNPGNVQFNNLRRIMVGVLAFPAQLRVEPFAGGGFAIMEALNVEASCVSCTGSQFGQLQDEANAAATKAFFWWMGGIDIKQGRLALYGHYILTSAAASFLIQGTTHTFQGGIRYSFGSAKEGITDRQ